MKKLNEIREEVLTMGENILFDEIKFRKWYANKVSFLRSKGQTLNPNPDDPRHHYDYRKAYNLKLEPSPTEHISKETGKPEYRWPDIGKLPGHPVPPIKEKKIKKLSELVIWLGENIILGRVIQLPKDTVNIKTKKAGKKLLDYLKTTSRRIGSNISRRSEGAVLGIATGGLLGRRRKKEENIKNKTKRMNENILLKAYPYSAEQIEKAVPDKFTNMLKKRKRLGMFKKGGKIAGAVGAGVLGYGLIKSGINKRKQRQLDMQNYYNQQQYGEERLSVKTKMTNVKNKKKNSLGRKILGAGLFTGAALGAGELGAYAARKLFKEGENMDINDCIKFVEESYQLAGLGGMLGGLGKGLRTAGAKIGRMKKFKPLSGVSRKIGMGLSSFGKKTSTFSKLASSNVPAFRKQAWKGLGKSALEQVTKHKRPLLIGAGAGFLAGRSMRQKNKNQYTD